MNNKNKEIFRYKFINKLKVFILLIIVLLGLFFSLNFFSTNNLPFNGKKFDFNFEEKNIIVSYFLFPISIVSIFFCILYLIEYSSTIILTNEFIIKRKLFSSDIKIYLEDITVLSPHKIILFTRIVEREGKAIYIIPSLKDYETFINFIFNKVKE